MRQTTNPQEVREHFPSRLGNPKLELENDGENLGESLQDSNRLIRVSYPERSENAMWSTEQSEGEVSNLPDF